MWFKLLIIFQLQLQLQLQVPILSSYSYSYFYMSVTLDSYSLTAEHQSLAKQRLVYIRTLYSHSWKQAQAAVRQETTERLCSWTSELFTCCVLLNAILFTTNHVSIYQLLMISVIYFSVTISYS